jgi:hypothetical protein
MEKSRLRLLESFERTILRVSINEATRPSALEMTNVAGLYEAYQWLGLGVELQIYPIEGAESVMSLAFPKLYEHIDSFSAWALFPNLKERLLAARSMKRFFQPLEAVDGTLPVSSNELHFAIMELARFSESRPAQALTEALLFLDGPRWSSLMAEPPSEDGIMEAMAAEYDPWANGYRDLVYAGWFALVQHIEELLEMFDPLKRPGRVAEGTWTTLKYEALRIHAWRFDLRVPELQSRFKQISATLGQVLAASDPDLGRVDPLDASRYVPQLIQRWITFTQPVQATAGA